jgi:hypothetical protein
MGSCRLESRAEVSCDILDLKGRFIMANWKTTVAGLLTGLAAIGQSLYTTIESGKPVNWALIVLSVGMMVALTLAKDFNVTGGTVQAEKKDESK